MIFNLRGFKTFKELISTAQFAWIFWSNLPYFCNETEIYRTFTILTILKLSDYAILTKIAEAANLDTVSLILQPREELLIIFIKYSWKTLY